MKMVIEELVKNAIQNPLEEIMMATLDTRLETEGYEIHSKSASGKPMNMTIKRMHNVQFTIGGMTQEYFDKLIIDAHGESGLQFIRREFRDWLDPHYENPGLAMFEDPRRWKPILNPDGQFDYTYNGRIHQYGQLEKVINLLSDDSFTRQAYISVYDPAIDASRLGEGYQVPCVLGYHFQINDLADGPTLDMTVSMRSCDLTNCLRNDIWLSNALHDYVRHRVSIQNPKIQKGGTTFFVMDLHAYPKIGEDQ